MLESFSLGALVIERSQLGIWPVRDLRNTHITGFGRIMNVRGDAIWVRMMCKCMRRGGYYQHELEDTDRLWRPEDFAFVDEADARRLINRHFWLTFPQGYCAEWEHHSGFADFLTPERFLTALAIRPLAAV